MVDNRSILGKHLKNTKSRQTPDKNYFETPILSSLILVWVMD